MPICKGLTCKNVPCKNRTRSKSGYCRHHIGQKENKNLKVTTLSKPEECPICFESLNDEKEPLKCGHWMHLECVKKHFKPECPVCRAPLDIKVTGSMCDPSIEFSTQFLEVFQYVPPENNVTGTLPEIINMMNSIISSYPTRPQFIDIEVMNSVMDDMMNFNTY